MARPPRRPPAGQSLSYAGPPRRGAATDPLDDPGAVEAEDTALDSESQVEMLLLDVTPLSMGVETGGGVFTVLISRNTTIPTERSEIFTTSVDNQNFVPIHILQGERPMAADNASLSHFELTGIPPAPRGVPKIQVTFRIDANGVVSIDAKDLGSGRSQQMNVTPTSGLTKDQIERIITEGERHQAAELIALYKEIRPVVQNGDLYRLKSPLKGAFSALEYLGQDGAEGVLFAFRTHLSEPIVLPPVRLAGLEPHTLYRVDGLNVPLSGAALMAVGITLELKDFSSVVRRFYRV